MRQGKSHLTFGALPSPLNAERVIVGGFDQSNPSRLGGVLYFVNGQPYVQQVTSTLKFFFLFLWFVAFSLRT